MQITSHYDPAKRQHEVGIVIPDSDLALLHEDIATHAKKMINGTELYRKLVGVQWIAKELGESKYHQRVTGNDECI